MFGSSLPPVVCRRALVLFTLFVFALVEWCPTHIVLDFCFLCLRLVYHMLPVSRDCPLLITPSVFSNVYLVIIIFSGTVNLNNTYIYVLNHANVKTLTTDY